jgi:hypothetical protein
MARIIGSLIVGRMAVLWDEEHLSQTRLLGAAVDGYQQWSGRREEGVRILYYVAYGLEAVNGAEPS